MGTTCSLEYVHRGQTYLTASHSQLPYFCYFLPLPRREGENNGLLAGVPLLPPPSRVLSSMWPSGKDMGRRVEGPEFESGQNVFPFASSSFFFLVLFVSFSF